MPMIRAGLVAAVLLAGAGTAGAQQSTPSTGNAQAPAAQTGPGKGACIVIGGDGKPICTPGMDPGGCAAQGREMRAAASFKPGEACP